MTRVRICHRASLIDRTADSLIRLSRCPSDPTGRDGSGDTLDEEVRGVGVSGPMMVTTVPEHPQIVTFVDRVIIPALVERFLSGHTVRRPDGDTPLAKPKDAA